MTLKLEDLIPEQSEITLKSTGKTYRFRPITLADEVWIQRKFGNDLMVIFKEIRMKEICEIAFHQMINEDKESLTKSTVTFIDDNGDSATMSIGGSELFMSLIIGGQEKTELVRAMLQNIGLSRSMQDDIEKKRVELKA